jgi:hypothetical protein
VRELSPVEAVEHVTLAVGEFALNHSVDRTGKVSGLHDSGGTLLLRRQTFAFIRGTGTLRSCRRC